MRIYCLTSIIIKNPCDTDPKSDGCKNEEEFFYPENNTKIILENIKNDPKIFNGYQLTEICIGYHFISDQKVYLMLIYRNDTKLLVIKMVPGSVSFYSVTNEVFEMNIATSKMFSINFDLLIRIRCIKNTQVRGQITEDEIQRYENFVKEIETFSKNEPDLQETAFGMFSLNLPSQSSSNVYRTKISDLSTLIKLLCDPETGNVENISTKSRYCQKVKCLSLRQKSRNSVDHTTAIEENMSNASFDSEIQSDLPSLSSGGNQSNKTVKNTLEENDMEMNLRKKQQRGRKLKYSDDTQRKIARSKATKKYSNKKESERHNLQKEVTWMEEMNKTLREDLTKNFDLLCQRKDYMKNNFLSEDCKESDGNLDIFQKASTISGNQNGTAEEKEKQEKMTNMEEKMASDETSAKRRDKNRKAVQRHRERKKDELKMLEERKRLSRAQNEILKEKIASIEKLIKFISETVTSKAVDNQCPTLIPQCHPSVNHDYPFYPFDASQNTDTCLYNQIQQQNPTFTSQLSASLLSSKHSGSQNYKNTGESSSSQHHQQPSVCDNLKQIKRENIDSEFSDFHVSHLNEH